MKLRKSAWMLLLAVILTALLQSCGGGGGGSSGNSGGGTAGSGGGGSGASNPGLMAGAVTFAGPYPTIGPVSYTTTSNTEVVVDAYPGQVLIHFDVTSAGTSAANIAQREALINATNTAVIIGKIPLIGFYLVQVPVGQENSFIHAMVLAGAGVNAAMPNVPVVRGDSTRERLKNQTQSSNANVALATGAATAPVAVTAGRNGGIVVIDDFNIFDGMNHGDSVHQTVAAVQAAIGGAVTIENQQVQLDSNGRIPLNNFGDAVTGVLNNWAAGYGASRKNITINLSWNACDSDSANCPNYPTYYADDWIDLSHMLDVCLRSIRDTLIGDQQDRFIVVQEIGNGQLDISSAFAQNYASQVALGILGNHLFVGASDLNASGVLYATQVTDVNYHNRASWYPGCIGSNLCGSSFAAPAVAALVAQPYALSFPAPSTIVVNFTSSQAREAVLVALLEYLDPSQTADPVMIFKAANEVLNVSSVQTSCGFNGGGGGPGSGASVSLQPLPLDFMEAMVGGPAPLYLTNQFTLTSGPFDGATCHGTITVSLVKTSPTSWTFNISDTFTSPNMSLNMFAGWSAVLPTHIASNKSVAVCSGTSSPPLSIGTPLNGSPPPPGAGTLAQTFDGIALGAPLATNAQPATIPQFLVYPSGAPPGSPIGAYPPLGPSCGTNGFSQVALTGSSAIGGTPVIAMYTHANYCSADGVTCNADSRATQANGTISISAQ